MIIRSLLCVSVLFVYLSAFAAPMQSIPFITNSGDTTSLEAFKGRVVLIVNTASECGHTPQYEGLEKLYEKYKERGFSVIALPANDFGQQEPGTDQQIREFCTTTYGVTFPLMAKISVKGETMHPLYKQLTSNEKTEGEIPWNFEKFLMDRDGNIAARFHYKTQPTSDEIVSLIEKLLETPASTR